jgi:alpha-galactosidase
MKSPLLIGADLRSIRPDSLAILKAREVIAINQDPLGVAGDLIWQQGANRVSAVLLHTDSQAAGAGTSSCLWRQLQASTPPFRNLLHPQIYAAALAGGARAVVTLNTHTLGGQYLTSNITVTWEQVGLPGDCLATVRDLFAEKDLGQFAGSFTAATEAHDVRALRITPVGGGAQGDTWRPWHSQPIYDQTGHEAAEVSRDAAEAGGLHMAGSLLAAGAEQQAMSAAAR